MRLKLNTLDKEDHVGLHSLMGVYPDAERRVPYNIVFVNGVAEEVPDGVGKFLVDQKLAKELKQVKADLKADAD